jgi:hypothetical protein
VSTRLTGFPAAGLLVSTADQLSEAAMRSLGGGGFVSTPLWTHAVQEFFVNAAPEWLVVRLLRSVMRQRVPSLLGLSLRP